MKTRLSLITAGIIAGGLALAAPASAQIGVRLGTDIDLGVNVRVGEPYRYRGYDSDRWYPYEKPRRRGRYYDAYDGYDCYRAFMYTWDDRHRTRYESYWCYNERGRDYEVRRTRVTARID